MLRAGVTLTAVAVLGLSSCTDDEKGVDVDPAAADPVPAPTGMVRTSWSGDPWALGSYAFLPVGATPESRARLAAVVDGRLAFAGEALDLANPATVHGALASGRAAAEAFDATAEGPERIVVVGAGAAGAAAAALLVRAGHQVVVVEARDRVGGRLATVRPAGWPVPVELGASWVHDSDASDLPADLSTLGIATAPFDFGDAILGSDGRPARPQLVADALDAIDEAVAWADDQDDDLSLADALERSGAVDGIDPGTVDLVIRTEVAAEYGADADELSAWWTFEEGSEGDDLLVTGGYGRLVDHLLGGIDVRLDWPVARVARDDSAVSVVGSSGESLDADRVLVTVPLGVLQAGTIEFDPPLPVAHREAIGTLGMGLLDKVWLRWDEQWWTETAQQWSRVAAADEPYVLWYNVAAVTGEPVLMALVGGDEARRWAGASDGEVLAAAMRSLQAFRDAGW